MNIDHQDVYQGTWQDAVAEHMDLMFNRPDEALAQQIRDWELIAREEELLIKLLASRNMNDDRIQS